MAIKSEVELLRQEVGLLAFEVKQLKSMMRDKVATVRRPTSVNGFVVACCEEDSSACVSKADLYREYREWCRANGKGKPKELEVFCRDLYRAMPNVKSVKLNSDGVRTAATTGVRLVRLAQPA